MSPRGNHTRLLQLLDQTGGVSASGCPHHTAQAAPQAARELTHHAEVVVDERPIGGNGQVAGVGIGVEKAEPHQLLQVAGGALFRYSGGHDSSLQQGLAIGDLDAGHIVEAKHPAGTQFPHHGRNADAGIVKKLLAEAGRVLGLQPEVELSEQHPPALLGNADPVAAATPTGMALHRGGNLLHHL